MALFGRRAAERTPLDGVDVVLADLDGVVYAGAGALPHAVESLNLSRDGRRLGYITNNASRTDASVAAHLSELGLATTPDGCRHQPSGRHATAGRPCCSRLDGARGRRRRSGERSREGRLPGHAERRGLAGGRRAGFRPRSRLGTARRGGVRARAAGGRGRHPVDRHQHRLDHPASPGDRAGQRHARIGRAHRRRAPRHRRGQAGGADLRRGGRALRCAASALPRRSARHRHPRRQPGRHSLRARADRHRSPEASARCAQPVRSRRSSWAICANCTSRIPRRSCATVS